MLGTCIGPIAIEGARVMLISMHLAVTQARDLYRHTCYLAEYPRMMLIFGPYVGLSFSRLVAEPVFSYARWWPVERPQSRTAKKTIYSRKIFAAGP